MPNMQEHAGSSLTQGENRHLLKSLKLSPPPPPPPLNLHSDSPEILMLDSEECAVGSGSLGCRPTWEGGEILKPNTVLYFLKSPQEK